MVVLECLRKSVHCILHENEGSGFVLAACVVLYLRYLRSRFCWFRIVLQWCCGARSTTIYHHEKNGRNTKQDSGAEMAAAVDHDSSIWCWHGAGARVPVSLLSPMSSVCRQLK